MKSDSVVGLSLEIEGPAYLVFRTPGYRKTYWRHPQAFWMWALCSTRIGTGIYARSPEGFERFGAPERFLEFFW